jgi:MoaA/NifB/PqqE/SkfB family radical SAM enzyme
MATFYNKNKLCQGLLSQEIANIGHFFSTIDLTRRCNLRCYGCRYHSPQGIISPKKDENNQDYPLDLFRKVIPELKTMGTRSICFSGEGEPFLHPQLLDFVSIAKEAGLRVTLLTNGTWLDESTIKSLIASRLDILKVSLWASSSEEYERNCPGTDPENFRRVAEGLKLLAQLKAAQKSFLPSVVLHQPVNRHNFQNTPAPVNLALATGCEGLSFSPLRTRRGRLVSGALSPDEERSFCRALKQLGKRLKGRLSHSGIDPVLRRFRLGEPVGEKLPCSIGWLHAYLKVDGAVLPCGDCSLVMGNLGDQSFQDIWNGPACRSFRGQGPTRTGLRALTPHGDCGFCCYVLDNARVHRFFRWIAPFCSGARSQPGYLGSSCPKA